MLAGRVSVVIPTYNRLPLLKRAVNSVVNQVYQNIELIILDNASTDGTREYLEGLTSSSAGLSIRVVRNSENIGFVKNIQQVKNYATGDFVCILSDDDYLLPELLLKGVAALESSPEVTLWYCRAKIVTTQDEIIGYSICGKKYETGKSFVRGFLRGWRQIPWAGALCRKTALDEIGWYRCNAISIDLATLMCCAMRGWVAFCSEVLCAYTEDAHNITANTKLEKWLETGEITRQFVTTEEGFSNRVWVPAVVRMCLQNILTNDRSLVKAKLKKELIRYPITTTLWVVYLSPQVLARLLLRRGKLFNFLRKLIRK